MANYITIDKLWLYKQTNQHSRNVHVTEYMVFNDYNITIISKLHILWFILDICYIFIPVYHLRDHRYL